MQDQTKLKVKKVYPPCPKCKSKKVQDYGEKIHPRYWCKCGQGFDVQPPRR